jgi:hypothetical protein
MSQAEIEAKFDALVGSVGAPERVAALKRAITALPEAEDLGGYADLLRAPVESQPS